MSEITSVGGLKRTTSSSRRRGAVKSLIIDFEQRKTNVENSACDILKMGAEHSSTIKSRPATIGSSSLVKQRVMELNHKLENDNQLDKRKRHKSTTENGNNKGDVLAKDFQRSKSVDVFYKDKDKYLRSRQILPKTDRGTIKNDNANRNDTNNNVSRKGSNKRATDNETMTKNGSTENLNRRKLSTQEKLNISPRKNINKIRSVKSIKRVFEKKQENSNLTHVNRKNNKTFEEKDKRALLMQKKCIPDDNSLSEMDNAIKSFNKVKTNTEDCHCDNNEEKSINLNKYKKHILNGIAKDFYAEKSDCLSCEDYTEDDFKEIESSLHEIEKTIKEIKELDINDDSSDLKNLEVDQDNANVSVENSIILSSLEELENIDVFLANHTQSDDDDEFGQRTFSSVESINFVEAYNREGKELIVTNVATIERKTIYEDSASTEILLDENGKIKHRKKFEEKILSKIYPSLEVTENDEQQDISMEIKEDDNLVTNGFETKEGNFSKDYSSAEEAYDDESEVSNRSTMYSINTNSTESFEQINKSGSEEEIESTQNNKMHVFEEMTILENNVEIRKDSSNGYERTIKTETIYDSYQNPRIAKVSNVDSEEEIKKVETPTDEAERVEVLQSPGGSKPKKDYIIEELIDTEKKYISHLEKVVWDYMPAITNESLPPSLIGKSRYLFGNIKRIYISTQRFYRTLRKCKNDHEEIAKTFLTHKDLFELYPLYSKNKPKADQYLLGDFKDVVTAREKQLNDRLGLASNLLTPIQRLGKYILFLEQIQKELLKTEGFASDNIYKAIKIVQKQMSRGNDYIAIDSIKECPINLLEQGSFLKREKFNAIKPRKYEAMLFLFEEMLVFTVVDPKNPELFLYRDSIKLNEMGIVTFKDEPLLFHLKRFPSYKKAPKEDHTFVIEAKKNKDKIMWTEEIEKRLWEQLVKCKEEQRELHNNQGKRNSTMALPDRSKQKKAGYSSLPSEIRKNASKSIFYY